MTLIICTIIIVLGFLIGYKWSMRCKHTWKTVKEMPIMDNTTNRARIGTQYHQQCTKCGKLQFTKD